MTQQTTNHQPIKGILQNHGSNPLGFICKHVNWLNKLTKELHHAIPKNYANHCAVAGFHKNRLTLAIDSATWVTKIRHLTPELIKNLSKRDAFIGIKYINCIIQPSKQRQSKTARHQITENAKRLIFSYARKIKDEEIRMAMEKLATNGEKRD